MKKHNIKLILLLIILCLANSESVSAQYDVVLGTDNVPITKFAYTRNGVHTVQTSGNQSTIATTDEIILDSVVVNDAGTSRQVRFINTPVTVVNNNFASNVTGVGVYDQGVEVFANNPTLWEPAMSGVVNDRNMLHYLFYDATSNIPSGFDFDIRWAKGMRPDDFIVVSERNGNTFFTLAPLDSFGIPIPGARTIRFGFQTGTTSPNGNNRYDWNTRFASQGRQNGQPQYMTVVPISLFNTSSSIHGLRIDNDGDADVKFYGMSDSTFDDNPITPSLPGITGNIFLDSDSLANNRVDGVGIDSAGNDPLYVSLVQGGVVQAVTAVNELGEYEFLLIPSGSYTIVLGTNPLGSLTPSLPTDWSNTGENDGAGTGSDGNPNGISPVIVVTDSLETNINFGIHNLVPLPVDYLYFKRGLKDNTTTLLNWATSAEYNSLRFDIYRSIGTPDNFSYIGNKLAAGNSNTIVTYQYEDNVRDLPAGLIYYRLFQVDVNGEQNESEIVAVRKVDENLQDRLTVYPNPANNEMIITLSNVAEGSYDLTVFNAEGRKVYSSQLTKGQRSTQEKVDVSQLPSGVYSVVCAEKIIKVTVIK